MPAGTGTAGLRKAIRWRYPASRQASVDVNAGLSCCLPRDTMSLAGLLSVITDDPQFRQVSSQAAANSDGDYPGDGADVTAPSALRPLLAAALTGLPRPASLS